MPYDPRTQRLAEFLVRYSTNVQPGERVSLRGPTIAEPLLRALEREVDRAGCWLSESGHDANVIIHAVATVEDRAAVPVPLPPTDQFWQRAATGNLRWTAVLVPSEVDARNAGLSLEEYADFLYRAGRLDHPFPAATWQALRQRQERLVQHLEPVQTLHFVTPRGTDLRVGVAGRTWINCAGHENFPDGEVFTAPGEGTAEGTVCFDFPSVYEGREATGVRLVLRGGCVVEASAEQGQDWLFHLLGRDAGARVVGEVALGCNYALNRPTKHPLLDEKIGGTFHLALGSAYPRTGGRNRSRLHWDLVADGETVGPALGLTCRLAVGFALLAPAVPASLVDGAGSSLIGVFGAAESVVDLFRSLLSLADRRALSASWRARSASCFADSACLLAFSASRWAFSTFLCASDSASLLALSASRRAFSTSLCARASASCFAFSAASLAFSASLASRLAFAASCWAFSALLGTPNVLVFGS